MNRCFSITRKERRVPRLPGVRLPGSLRKGLLISILVVAAALRVGYWMEIKAHPLTELTAEDRVFDPYNFVTLAQDIRLHGWLGSRIIAQSPVYAYVIAGVSSVTGGRLAAVTLFQIVCSVAALWFLFQLGRVLFDNDLVGLTAAGMAAVYGPLVFYDATILRASLMASVNVGALYALVRAVQNASLIRMGLGGLGVGLSTALRPGVCGLIGLLAAGLFPGRFSRKVTAGAVFLLGFILVIGGVALRNRALGSKVWISSSDPATFWRANVPEAPGIGGARPPSADLIAQKTRQSRIKESLQELARLVRENPRAYISLYARKFKMLFNTFEIPANFSFDLMRREFFFLRAAFLDFRWISPLTLLGFFVVRGRREVWLLSGMFVLLAGFVWLFHIQGRYRIPFIPLAILLAAYGALWLCDQIRMRRWVWAMPATIVLCLLAVWTAPARDVIQRYWGNPIRDIDFSNMANAYLYRKQKMAATLTPMERRRLLREALRFRQESVRYSSRWTAVPFLHDLAMIYGELGEKEKAIETLEKALSLQPTNELIRTKIQRLKESSHGR